MKSNLTLAICFGWICLFNSITVAEQPNIVVIIADDLGYGDVGFHGGKIKTPNLDALAAEGTRLEQFYVQPVCSPTRASLMTGRYPIRYGLQVGVVRPWANYGLPLDEKLLPQVLSEAGYETAICGKWHLGELTKEYQPTQRGFDHQYGHFLGAIDYFKHDRDGGHDWHRDDQPNYDEGYSTHLIRDEAIRVIKERDQDKPLFLYVPFNAPHTPLQVPDVYLQDYADMQNANRKKYAGMVACMDEAVGNIVDAIKQELPEDNTLIFFCSDNGGIPRLGSNGELRGRKGTVYEGGVRVPAIISWKGKIESGKTIEQPMHIVDLLPTFAELAGTDTEGCKQLDGLNVWPTITNNEPSPHDYILHNSTPNAGGAIRGKQFKLVHSPNAAANPNKKVWELFDLTNDPSEQTDVSNANPEKLEELKQKYREFAKAAVEPLNKGGGAPADFKAPEVWGHRGR